jgi:hypothetical protein
MSSFRYRDDETSLAQVLTGAALGGLTGFAVGVILAQKVGGISGLTTRLRARFRDLGEELALGAEEIGGDFEDDEIDSAEAALEERVLDAFRRDPVLQARAVDIGAVGGATIELSGWVNTSEEAERAMEVTRNTPGVETVVNRLEIGDRERLRESTTERFEQGDDSLNEARWEGQRVGTGRRRQGTSDESDRHADPKPELEKRWLDKRRAMMEAADDPEGIVEGVTEDLGAERHERSTRPPRGDHATEPEQPPEGEPPAA